MAHESAVDSIGISLQKIKICERGNLCSAYLCTKAYLSLSTHKIFFSAKITKRSLLSSEFGIELPSVALIILRNSVYNPVHVAYDNIASILIFKQVKDQ